MAATTPRNIKSTAENTCLILLITMKNFMRSHLMSLGSAHITLRTALITSSLRTARSKINSSVRQVGNVTSTLMRPRIRIRRRARILKSTEQTEMLFKSARTSWFPNAIWMRSVTSTSSKSQTQIQASAPILNTSKQISTSWWNANLWNQTFAPSISANLTSKRNQAKNWTCAHTYLSTRGSKKSSKSAKLWNI